MRVPKPVRPILMLAMAALMLPMMATTVSAEVTTISAEINACRQNVNSYSVQLQTGNSRVPASDVPAFVTLHFADGSTAQADLMTINLLGTAQFRLGDDAETYREIALVSATAEFDVAKYPTYQFKVTAYPCDPTPNPEPDASVSGQVVQQGNLNPVANLTVCLVEADLCTTTNAAGAFVIPGVAPGTYTLETNGSNWKPQTNVVNVASDDVHVEIVQSKGGGH